MENTKKVILFAIAILVMFSSLVLLSFFNTFSALLAAEGTLRENPFGIIGIFGILVFGGIYLLNTGAKIFKGIF